MADKDIFSKVEEFYDFLQKKSVPKGYKLKHKPKLTARQAFAVIYVLQEFLQVLPDNIEKCDKCGVLFDRDREGYILDDQYDLNGKTLPK